MPLNVAELAYRLAAARERSPEGIVEIPNTFGTFFGLYVHGGLLNEAS
jgi:hypothetical protein